MDHATIEDLAIDKTLVLSPMVKQNLVKVIEQEFNSQTTIYNAEAEVKKEEILEQYKKGVGFELMKKAYDKAEAEKETACKRVKEAEDKLHNKGLTPDGSRHQPYHCGILSTKEREAKKSMEKLDRLLKTVNDSGPNAVRNKIISRLWLANTAGEAMVILRQVLGNGIIPSISKSEVKQLTQE